MTREVGRDTVLPGAERQVLDFDLGVSAHEPATPGGYWRLRWVEGGRRRDTTARSREAAIAKATELVERLAAGTPTHWASAPGTALLPTTWTPPGRAPGAGPGPSATGRTRRRTAAVSSPPSSPMWPCGP